MRLEISTLPPDGWRDDASTADTSRVTHVDASIMRRAAHPVPEWAALCMVETARWRTAGCAI